MRRYKARRLETLSGCEAWDLRKTRPRPAVVARVEYDVDAQALDQAAVAGDAGALPDLTADDIARLLQGISAHSTRVGLKQDLFASGEDLAGIMDALRWKSPRMPLAYNRAVAAEQGAVGQLLAKLG